MNVSDRRVAAMAWSEAPAALVVLERGSNWPAHVHRSTAGCVALVQEANEAHRELLRRTCNRVQAIERTGQSVGLAVLSCNDDTTGGGLEERVPLAWALLRAVLPADKGRLLLLGPRTASATLRVALLGLAGTLTEALAGSSASVSVLLDDPRRAGAL